jgi:outer membrane protein
MNRVKIFLVASITVLVICSGIVYVYLKIPKIAYINSSKVFNEFKLKKELEKDLKKLESSRQSLIDSLKLDLNMKFEKVNGSKKVIQQEVDEYKRMQQQFYLKEKQFKDDYEALAGQYTEQVWKQLNQYIKEYGEKNAYDYILGTKGEGEIMYANDREDLTLKVTEYANSKYEGDIK